eukprot:14455564-Ditylum_brightwellii.AAC.1
MGGAIETVEAKHEKMTTKVNGLKARHTANNKNLKKLQGKNQELDMDIQELESLGEQQIRRIDDIERNQAVIIAENKTLHEKVTAFETEQAAQNKKIQSLESELKNLRAYYVHSFFNAKQA